MPVSSRATHLTPKEAQRDASGRARIPTLARQGLGYLLTGGLAAVVDIGLFHLMIASMAGVDPINPMQPAPQQADRLRGIVSDEPMPDWPFPPPLYDRR